MLGTNDGYYRVAQPADSAAWKAAVWDFIHADDATATIVSATPLWRGNKDVANAIGKKLIDYATAFDTSADVRPWAQKLDCLPVLSQPDFVQTAPDAQETDDLHPSDNGHYLFAQFLFSKLTGTEVSAYGEVGDTIQADDPRWTLGSTWRRNNTPLPETGIIFLGGVIYYTTTPEDPCSIIIRGQQIEVDTFKEASSGQLAIAINDGAPAIYSLQSTSGENGAVITSEKGPAGQLNKFTLYKIDQNGTTNVYLTQTRVTNGSRTPTPHTTGTPLPTPTAGSQLVTWRDVAPYLTATVGQLEMTTAGPNGALFTGIARSTKAIAANREGAVDFLLPVRGTDVFGGMSYGQAPRLFGELRHVFYRQADGSVVVYEGSVEKDIQRKTSADSDTYRVEVVGTNLVYSINGTPVRTITAPRGVQLYAAAALNAVGAKMTNVQISSAALVTY